MPLHMLMMMSELVVVDFGEINTIITFFSSVSIILGALFVVLQIRDNKKLVEAATEQAKAAVVQAQTSTDTMKQTNEIADMDIIMRLYEFANTAEVQSAWLTVLESKIKSFEDFRRLSKPDQVSFYQIASLFESLGVLVERGIITLDIVEDMFLTETAWKAMRPFLEGIRSVYGGEGYSAFQGLHAKLAGGGTEVSGQSPTKMLPGAIG